MRPLLLLALAGSLMTCAALKKAQESLVFKVNDPRRQVAGTIECERMEKRTVPWEEEREVGGVLALALAQKGGGFAVAPVETDGGVARPDDSELDQLNRAVAEVGFTVTAYSPRPELPWTFGVLDTDVPNAFSAPGGYIFVTRGLLKQMDNESQLAGVIAHEVGHVTKRHALNVYNTTRVASCYANKGLDSSLGTVNIGGNNGGRAKSGALVSGADAQKVLMDKVLDPFIDYVATKGFAQGDEFEADEMATDLLVIAGYDPREYRALLAKLSAERGFLPNHPSPRDRALKVDARLNAEWKAFAWDKNPRVPLDQRIAQLKRVTARKD